MKKKKNTKKVNVNFVKKRSKKTNVTTDNAELSAVLSVLQEVKQERDKEFLRNEELEKENIALKHKIEAKEQQSLQQETPALSQNDTLPSAKRMISEEEKENLRRKWRDIGTGKYKSAPQEPW